MSLNTTGSIKIDLGVVSNYDIYGHDAVHALALVMLCLSFVGNLYIITKVIMKRNFGLLVFRFPFYVSLMDTLFSLVHMIDHIHLLSQGDGQRPQWLPVNSTNSSSIPYDKLQLEMNSGSNPWMITSPDYVLVAPAEDMACVIFGAMVSFAVCAECLLVMMVGLVTLLRVVYSVRLNLGWMDIRLIATILSITTCMVLLVGGLSFFGRSEYYCLIGTFSRRGQLGFAIIIGGTMTVMFLISLACYFVIIRYLRIVMHTEKILNIENSPATKSRVRALEDAENRIVTYLAIYMMRLVGPAILSVYLLYQVCSLGLYVDENNLVTDPSRLPAKIPTWAYAICSFTYNLCFLNAIVYYRHVKLYQERVNPSASSAAINSSSEIGKRDPGFAQSLISRISFRSTDRRSGNPFNGSIRIKATCAAAETSQAQDVEYPNTSQKALPHIPIPCVPSSASPYVTNDEESDADDDLNAPQGFTSR